VEETRMFRFVTTTILILFSFPALAENRIVTIRGVVDFPGTSDSSISGIGFCHFAIQSEIADKIYSTCELQGDCELKGVVTEYNELLNIISIRKIDTNVEPSQEVIEDAALWGMSLQDKARDDKVYVHDFGISDFHEFYSDGEVFWKFNYNSSVSYHGTFKRESISGTVSMVKRGEKWYYFK